MTAALNPTAAALLGLLTRGPMSGYDLHQLAARTLGDFWTVTRSQVYRELATLDRDGLVEAGQPGARSRRPYAVTAGGRTAFAQWVAREPGEEVIRFPLLLTLSFGDWVGRAGLLRLAAAQRAAHAERLTAYEQEDRAIPAGQAPFARATLAFGRHYERAVLAWMDELPELLADVPDAPGQSANQPAEAPDQPARGEERHTAGSTGPDAADDAAGPAST